MYTLKKQRLLNNKKSLLFNELALQKINPSQQQLYL